jgi:hypothetical protein
MKTRGSRKSCPPSHNSNPFATFGILHEIPPPCLGSCLLVALAGQTAARAQDPLPSWKAKRKKPSIRETVYVWF